MKAFIEHEKFRDSLLRDLEHQIFGPSPDDKEQLQQEVLSVSPLQLYATGVLFPQKLQQNRLEDGEVEDSKPDSNIVAEDLLDTQSDGIKSTRSGNVADQGSSTEEQEPLNLANEFSPSATGISFRLNSP